MEKHLERALIEFYYALADFDQGRARGQRPVAADKAEALLVSLQMSRWGLELALSILREIGATGTRQISD